MSKKTANKVQAPKAPAKKVTRTTVSVVYGVNRLDRLRVAGKTVAQVRKQVAQALNIPDGVEALVGGKNVGPRRMLKAGDTLEFVKLAGNKG